MKPNSLFSVVEARVQDVPDILDIFRLTGQFVPDAVAVTELWNEMSGVPHVAKVNLSGQIIGFCSVVREHQFRGGVVVHAENVVVDPQFQGMGAGSLLLQSVVNQAESIQAMRVALECLPSLIPFYRRLGFNVSGCSLTKQVAQRN
jgi:GNAT superfamily N-acetyltransferase